MRPRRIRRTEMTRNTILLAAEKSIVSTYLSDLTNQQAAKYSQTPLERTLFIANSGCSERNLELNLFGW